MIMKRIGGSPCDGTTNGERAIRQPRAEFFQERGMTGEVSAQPNPRRAEHTTNGAVAKKKRRS
jgi:hypothetical protein